MEKRAKPNKNDLKKAVKLQRRRSLEKDFANDATRVLVAALLAHWPVWPEKTKIMVNRICFAIAKAVALYLFEQKTISFSDKTKHQDGMFSYIYATAATHTIAHGTKEPNDENKQAPMDLIRKALTLPEYADEVFPQHVVALAFFTHIDQDELKTLLADKSSPVVDAGPRTRVMKIKYIWSFPNPFPIRAKQGIRT